MRMTRFLKYRNNRRRRFRKKFLLIFVLPVMIALMSYLVATLFILPLLAK